MINNNNLSTDDALEQQLRLKDNTDIFKESITPPESVRKEKNALTLENWIILLNGRKKALNALKVEYFQK